MSDTPRTDGEEWEIIRRFTNEEVMVVIADFARTLERELAAVTRERDALRAEVERLTECLKRANDQAEEFERKWYLRGDEVERLRGALEHLIERAETSDDFQYGTLSTSFVRDIARAALQEPTP